MINVLLHLALGWAAMAAAACAPGFAVATVVIVKTWREVEA